MKKWVYLFTEGNANMRELLGGKGANLAEMTNIGLPVPQGFTITTEACTQYYEDGREINEEIQGQINEYITKMEEITGKKFGDHENPLLVSVRSGARASMPGMMDTILNLGLNETVVNVESVIFRPESLLQTAELEHFPACRTPGIPSVIHIPSLLLCKGMSTLDPLGGIKFREIGACFKRYIRQLFRINIPFFLRPDSLIGVLRIADIHRLILSRRCSFRRQFFLTAVSSRITAQADDECCDHRHRTDEDTERRLVIIQHMTDPVLHMILSEG